MWFFISANCPEAEHFVAIFDVITERKQSEIKLQESERAKSAFLDIFNESQRIAMIGSWEWNITTNQVWWSDETYRIFGVTKHNYVPSFEANGKFLEPDELERYGKEFEHCLQTGKLLDIDVRVIVDSGLKCINAKGQVMYDDSGLPLRFIGTVLDVTLYKRAEDRIKRNELRLKTVTDVLQHPCETIQGFLDYALDQAIALTESDIGFIYHYCEDRREFVLNSWSKKAMAECAIDKPPTCYKLDKTGLWGEVVRQRRSIIVNDFQAVNPLKKGYPEGHVQITKFMTVPIFKGGDIVGVIGLGNKRTDYENFDVLEILLLMGVVWKVIDRKQFEVTLLASLREKETLLREIHHRVKNNLQIISSLLKLQANYCKDDTLQQIFNESQLRIRAMASVHVQLYKSQNFTSINFADYTQETATQLFRAYNTSAAAISLVILIDEIMLPIDTAIPCGLILNELITNALKYAFPGGRKGEITIEMTHTENELRLLFEDNGVGFPSDVDFFAAGTYGLKLVHMLVKQLDGSIEQFSDGGTRYVIVFKEQHHKETGNV